jgi:hypothetical protein
VEPKLAVQKARNHKTGEQPTTTSVIINTNLAPPLGLITLARLRFHKKLLAHLPLGKGSVCANANNKTSKSDRITSRLFSTIATSLESGPTHEGQDSADTFRFIVGSFIEETFLALNHLRPGQWKVITAGSEISQFDQYHDLEALLDCVNQEPALGSSLTSDYLITPDLVIARFPEPDGTLNTTKGCVVSGFFPAHSPLRKTNNTRAILHASISCKWTIRSDRSQNTRTEALNLMRNRKGTVPHAVAVTAEPLPSRIGSIAYGTGDLDCIYHIALPELLKACIDEGDDEDIRALIEGRRLRDISDLPLDLAT